MHIRVRVKTGARRDLIRRVADGVYAVEVKAEPQHNAANDRIRELLANTLTLNVKRIQFVSGQRSTSKLFKIL